MDLESGDVVKKTILPWEYTDVSEVRIYYTKYFENSALENKF